ncbi:MAG TPA: hypothetical protein VGN14_10385 [Candidatus Elarobacter sp.]
MNDQVFVWAVKWRDEKGGLGCQFCETLEKAEILKQHLLGKLDERDLPMGLTVVRPAGRAVVDAWIEPRDPAGSG